MIMELIRRIKKNRYEVEGGEIPLDISFNKYAGALKTLPLEGQLQPLGPANSAINCDLGDVIAFYNDSSSAKYVAFGDSTVSAPTGPTNGIALKPNDYTYLSVGMNNYFISNSSSVYAYKLIDDTTLTKTQR